MNGPANLKSAIFDPNAKPPNYLTRGQQYGFGKLAAFPILLGPNYSNILG